MLNKHHNIFISLSYKPVHHPILFLLNSLNISFHKTQKSFQVFTSIFLFLLQKSRNFFDFYRFFLICYRFLLLLNFLILLSIILHFRNLLLLVKTVNFLKLFRIFLLFLFFFLLLLLLLLVIIIDFDDSLEGIDKIF